MQLRDQSKVVPPRPDSHWPRRRAWSRGVVFAGSGIVALATSFPWAVAVYSGQEWYWDGWDLYYLHGPQFTLALLPLLLAVAATIIGVVSRHRPTILRAAVAPGSLLLGFLAFEYIAVTTGPFSGFMRSFPGYTSSRIGLGFWMMLVAALAITGAAVAADTSPPPVARWRLGAWLIGGLLELGLLYSTPAIVVPIMVVSLVIIGLLVFSTRAFRRRRELSPKTTKAMSESDDHPLPEDAAKALAGR